MGVTITDDGLTVDTTSPQEFYRRSFASLKEANADFHKDATRKKRVRLVDRNFATADPTTLDAIRIERAYHTKIDGVSVVGPYHRGVAVYFGLYAGILDVSVEGANVGFFVGSGAAAVPFTIEKLWPDGEHHNSASNQALVKQSRFHSQIEGSTGFVLNGGDNVVFTQTTVEGSKRVARGWNLAPRAPRGSLTLDRSWLEVAADVAVEFDGFKTQFEITRFNMQVLPDVFLDCRGDQGSTIIFDRNNWPAVPKMILSKSTNVELGRNSFSDDEFWDQVERV